MHIFGRPYSIFEPQTRGKRWSALPVGISYLRYSSLPQVFLSSCGVRPRTRRVCSARWLWWQKPFSRAICPIGMLPPRSCMAARSTRRRIKYWWGGIPSDLRNSVLKCETLKPATSAISPSPKSRPRLSSMYPSTAFNLRPGIAAFIGRGARANEL